MHSRISVVHFVAVCPAKKLNEETHKKATRCFVALFNFCGSKYFQPHFFLRQCASCGNCRPKRFDDRAKRRGKNRHHFSIKLRRPFFLKSHKLTRHFEFFTHHKIAFRATRIGASRLRAEREYSGFEIGCHEIEYANRNDSARTECAH